MRTPAFGTRESRFQRGAGGGGLAVHPAGRAVVTKRPKRSGHVADQRNVGPVHAMVAADGGDVDHGLIGAKRIAPADAHLDRVIAQKEDRIGLRDQGHQDAVGLGRQAGTAKAKRVSFGHQALALVGGDQRNGMRPTKICNR